MTEDQAPLFEDQPPIPVPKPRNGKPYIWVTYAAALLSGDRQCEWWAWFRAHFQAAKIQRDSDLIGWTSVHNEAVKMRAAALEEDGLTVKLEAANMLRLEGQSAIVAGRPDIVARYLPPVGQLPDPDPRTIIDDVKTGRAKDEHFWQVLIYLLMWQDLEKKPAALGAWLIYTTPGMFNRFVPVTELTNERRSSIYKMLRRIAGPELSRRPSATECRFCDVTKADCPDRIDADDAIPTKMSDQF